MPKLCTANGCDKPHRARGLCGTHYNQQHHPNRHRKVEMTCDGCGTAMLKEAGRRNRYDKLYCSSLCRDVTLSGKGVTCTLPVGHWARLIGATCAFSPGHIVTCGWCGAKALSYQPDARYCQRRCQKAHGKATRRGREANASGTYTWVDITRLWVAFGKACAYCTTPTALADIQPEHVVPLSKGGANNISNLLPSCAPCNSDKRDLLLHEWTKDRARRKLAPRITSWAASDTRYMHMASGQPLTLAA